MVSVLRVPGLVVGSLRLPPSPTRGEGRKTVRTLMNLPGQGNADRRA
jgi:hypothetical protein